MMAYEYINKIAVAETKEEVYSLYGKANRDITVSFVDFCNVQCAAYDRIDELEEYDKRKV